MIPTTNALLISVAFLCGLDTVLSQRGRCIGNQCFAVFQEPKDFSGAKKSCEDLDGLLFVYSLEHVEEILRSPPSELSGSYWLELRSAGRTTEEAAAGLQNCPSISVSMGGNISQSWELCSNKLDGFLCQYTFKELCGGLQAGGGLQVKYTTHMGFEVYDSETFPPGTIAQAEKAGSEYPESKHVCASSVWMRAPWTCEVLQGGCEHNCSSTTHTCTCPARQTLHPNDITCTTDPCGDCAHGCQREGDAYVCTCRQGYRLAEDRKLCVDVNECKEENPCTGEGEECENTQGAFECGCKDGFVEDDGVCVDAAICIKCEHMLCDKFNGVYECVCRKGFKVSPRDPTKCVQHCTESDCRADCIATENKVQCYCPDGYIHDVKNNTHWCTDINECENKKQCDHTCVNLLGGYRCLCDEGFKLHDVYKCAPVAEEEEEEGGSGSSPSYATQASPHPVAVPSYVKTGSILGISVFLALCAVLLFFLIRNIVKRCGKFELSSFKHPDIDIFYLQQVTTETYKRLSFDKQFKNDSQMP